MKTSLKLPKKDLASEPPDASRICSAQYDKEMVNTPEITQLLMRTNSNDGPQPILAVSVLACGLAVMCASQPGGT